MPKVGMEPIRRSQIINAALEVICLEGIDKMSLDLVAKTAECSKGVVSYYFQSKDNLILEAFRAFLNYYKIKINSQIDNGMSPIDMLKVVQENALPEFYNLEDEGEARINVSELDGLYAMNIPADKKAKLFIHFFSRAMLDGKLQDIIKDVYMEDHSGIAEIIDYGMKTGEFRKTDKVHSAYGVMAMYLGISVLRVVGFKPEGIEDDRDVFWLAAEGMLKDKRRDDKGGK